MKTAQVTTNVADPSAIAIIGIGCLFPDAAHLDEYWQNIKAGRDSIGPIPLSHWRPEDYYAEDPKTPDHTYAKTGGFLKPYDFDPLKFGIAPSSLEATDSTQLLAMVCAHEALLDAGYGPKRIFNKERVACIVGVTGTLELVIPLGARLGHPIWKQSLAKAGIPEATAEVILADIASHYVPWQEASFPGLLGNVVAGRIANRFDLGGTNSVVDAACASSLAAVHMATMELQSGRADMVITGGMDTFNDIFMYMCFSKTPALSPSGSARPFDALGDGTALGEGLGAIVLKRLVDAERDGDRIYGVLKGIGSSSDGKGQAVYAPKAEGQMKALARAYEVAGVSARTIGLVEGHGTGTRVGDGVELSALTQVYRSADAAGSWCALGSVKSQIGHTKAAAGAAGLIKLLMALYHKILPPTIKVEQPHPLLDNSPFVLYDKVRPWLSLGSEPRRAAVSAFGFGGSNYHAVLEEYGSSKPGVDWDPELQILAFSAESKQELQVAVMTTLALVEGAAGTLRSNARLLRRNFNARARCRLTLVARGQESAQKLLKAGRNWLASTGLEGPPSGLHFQEGTKTGGLAFVFAGQGSQELGMLRELACSFPEFIEILSLAESILQQQEPTAPRLGDCIYPGQSFSSSDLEVKQRRLTETRYAQLSLGAVGAASLKVLASFGVKPAAVAGHSYGELLALHAAGVLELRDLLELSYVRGYLMAREGKADGAMLAVFSSSQVIEKLLSAHEIEYEWANYNAEEQIVLAASKKVCEQLAKIFKTAGIMSRRLDVSTAFHSSFVASAASPFHARLESHKFTQPSIPVFANSTAGLYPDDAEGQRQTLSQQIAMPVRFASMLQNFVAKNMRTVVEIGPQRKLTGLLRTNLSELEVLSFDSVPGSALQGLAQLLAQLAALGHEVDLQKWDAGAIQEALEDKKSFTVSISGANYRRPEAKVASQVPSQVIPAVNLSPSKPVFSSATVAQKSSDEALNRTQLEGFMSSSPDWQRLEKIMQDMQDNQRKTTEAHTLFLENQRQFQGLLQGLISGQSLPPMKASSIGVEPFNRPLAPSVKPIDLIAQPLKPIPKAAPTPALEIAAAPAQTEKTKQSQSSSPSDLVVFEILARCTGYPIELLQVSMQLEADLGIDSIKKVEIFSQIQSCFPHIEAEGGRLGDLQSIADLMSLVTIGQAPDRARVGAWAASESAVAASAPKADHATILGIIAEKTGFPVAMLQPEMALENDLGIDSIKKVEIFSAVEEALVLGRELAPDALGRLHSIADILHLFDRSSSLNSADLVLSFAKADEEKIWQVIADKTGYPRELLQESMELEADLGIDSIKRVEIISAVTDCTPSLRGIEPERFAGLQRLADLFNLARSLGGGVQAVSEDELLHPDLAGADWDLSKKKSLDAALTHSPQPLLQAAMPELGGARLHLSQPQPEVFAVLPHLREWQRGTEVWITDDGSHLARSIMQHLQGLGLLAKLVSLAQVDRLQPPAKLHALIVLAPTKIEGQVLRWLNLTFRLLKKCGPALKAAAPESLFGVLSRNGGHFGTAGIQQLSQVYGGALAALAKTVAHEWEGVHARAIDLGRDFADGGEVAQRCLDLMTMAGPVELGMTRNQIYELRMQSHEQQASAGSEVLNRTGALILVTGGARGVTAATLVPMAKNWRSKFVIWGRTPLAATEPRELLGIDDPALLKRALLALNPELILPRDLAEAAKHLLQQRELRHNIAQLQDLGAEVIYETVDVSRDQDLRLGFERLYAQHGVPEGIIHGAGVIRDKWILEQKDEEFTEVLATKLRILPYLEEAARQGTRWLALFSSSTARVGRKGQVAYGVANETLNKFAQYCSEVYPHCYALAFNWGPWAGGMVHDGLKKVFAAEGIATIPLAVGADIVLQAITHPEPKLHELMVIAIDPEATASIATDWSEFVVNIGNTPILLDHVIKHRAVVPAALLLEWLAAAAMSRFPQLVIAAIEDFQIFKGIILDAGQDITLRVEQKQMAGSKEQPCIELQLSSRGANAQTVPHAKANFKLSSQLLAPSSPHLAALSADPAQSKLDPYAELLFHGENLQLLQPVHSCQKLGVDASLQSRLGPRDWSQVGGLRQHWLVSGEWTDAVFQAAIIWSSVQKGSPNLPAKLGRLEFFQATAEGKLELRWRMVIADTMRLVADAEILDGAGQLLMRFTGIEAIIDAKLAVSFLQTQMQSQKLEPQIQLGN